MKRWLLSVPAAVLAATLLAGGLAFAFRPAAAEGFAPLSQILAVVTCSSGHPCQTYSNTAHGTGLKGISAQGSGLIGVTNVNSTSPSNGRSGVLGQDLSSSGIYDAGLKGTSTNGNGVVGTTSHGTGVAGVTGNGIGVSGSSSTGVGVLGTSSISDAVQGTIGSGVGSSFHAGVAGLDRSTSGNTNEGVYGDTTFGMGVQGVSLGSGIGVYGSSATGAGIDAVGGSPNTDSPALSIVSTSSSDIIDACAGVNPCGLADAVFSVSAQGHIQTNSTILAEQTIFASDVEVANSLAGRDVIATGGSMIIEGPGSYYKNGNCVAGCTTSPTSARRVRTYGAQSSQPTVEDLGEAQLVGGQAYVHIDPAFANVIDQHARYLVTVTPEGDSNGLYVTQKTLSGFLVRENRGGKSSLAFTYRVETKPFGATAARLPMVDEPIHPRPTFARSRHRGAILRSP